MIDGGLVWSAIRGELEWLRADLKAAVQAEQYEVESAIFDGIARKLAAAVLKKFAVLEEGAENEKSNGPSVRLPADILDG